MMRKLLLVNMAVAALAAGALTSDRASATTLGASAGARAAEGAGSPIEAVTYYPRYKRPYAFYPYKYPYHAYGKYPYHAYGKYPRRLYGDYPRRFKYDRY
jgi:hypothetical protein